MKQVLSLGAWEHLQLLTQKCLLRGRSRAASFSTWEAGLGPTPGRTVLSSRVLESFPQPNIVKGWPVCSSLVTMGHGQNQAPLWSLRHHPPHPGPSLEPRILLCSFSPTGISVLPWGACHVPHTDLSPHPQHSVPRIPRARHLLVLGSQHLLEDYMLVDQLLHLFHRAAQGTGFQGCLDQAMEK